MSGKIRKSLEVFRSALLTKPASGGPVPTSSLYATLPVEETAKRLNTDALSGLSSQQDALHRRSVHGLNVIEGEEADSLWKKFLAQFRENPLILLLFASAAISFAMGNVDDAVSITLAITIVIGVATVQEYRSEKSLEALNRLVPHYAHLVRNGHLSTVNATQLVPGDVVAVNVGDRVPADIRLVDAVALEIDESVLTGENIPVVKMADIIPENPNSSTIPISERYNIAFMSTLVRNGRGRGIVISTGADTEFGHVFSMMKEVDRPKTPLQNSMDHLGKQLSYASFVVIGIICLIGIIQGRPWLDMFTIGVSLAVAAIPEGLPIIVTVTLALGVLRMASRKAIVRRLPSVETLGSVNVLCCDKTGTLTLNHMTVSRFWVPEIGPDGLELSKAVAQSAELPILYRILEIGNFCNNVIVGEYGKLCGQATDIAFIEALSAFGLEDRRKHYERISELPFSSDLKYMAVVARPSRGGPPICYMKGATDAVLASCGKYFTSKSSNVNFIDDAFRAQVRAAEDKMADQGLRILALASGQSLSGKPELTGLTFAGLVAIYDPPRRDVERAIGKLLRGGIKIIMITGDSEHTATSIARNLNIPFSSSISSELSVMSGTDIDKMNEEQLAAAIARVSVFARSTPRHKMKIISALQCKGLVVAMTGDGVNDAPALKKADIGISMGVMGSDVAKEAADMILTDDNFLTILASIEEGKGIFYNIQSFLTFQLSTSLAALSLIALATLLGLSNPLNAMQILWINILMDGPPAQSLGVEPVEPEVMNSPPRPKNAPILTPFLYKRIVIQGSIIFIGTFLIFVHELQDGSITVRDTTMTFTCFVLFDMFNALSCRSANKSVFEIGLFSNKMFNLAVGLSLLGQLLVIYVPWLQAIFQTEPLTIRDFITLIAIGSIVLWVDEGRKWWRRRQLKSTVMGGTKTFSAIV